MIAANPVGFTITVYVAAILSRVLGYDHDFRVEALQATYSVMELLVIGASVLFQFLVISPQTGYESVLSSLTGLVAFTLFFKPLLKAWVID